MKIKDSYVVNLNDKNNVKIFNLETDELIELNEEASLIFNNFEKTDDEIASLFNETYEITTDANVLEDIREIKDYLRNNIYE